MSFTYVERIEKQSVEEKVAFTRTHALPFPLRM